MPPPSGQPRKPDLGAFSNERNQYIPSFIANKPFYVPDDASTDYLEHQRLQQKQEANSKWYDRGAKQGPAATKFRKGACDNCGAMTHKAKDCLSRKRKAGARWTGKDIQADEVVQGINLDWDAKRDRWNGYDAGEYQTVVDDFNELEQLKRARLGGQEAESGDKYEEETDMGRQQSTSTRQLRLREDTAKYLLNLDLDSAKYDPKTRSMLEPGRIYDQAAQLVAEEGFVRQGGEAADFEKAQRYAWERQERGHNIHLQANPTAGALALKQERIAEAEKKEKQQQVLVDKYGDQTALLTNKRPSNHVLVTESELFVEYYEDGGVKGAPQPKPVSKYKEDLLANNHTSVWGSWWNNSTWGFACCHSTVKNSYCTGEAGKEALAEDRRRKAGIQDDANSTADAQEQQLDGELLKSSSTYHTLSKRKQRGQKQRIPEQATITDAITGVITEEEMDMYQRTRVNSHDPMASFIAQDQLI